MPYLHRWLGVIWITAVLCLFGLTQLAGQVAALSQAAEPTARAERLAQRKAARAARHARGSDKPVDANPKKPTYAPGRLIVKYKDSLQSCAHCLLKRHRPFQTATTDGSGSLDRLHGQLHVSNITPVFRAEPEGGPALSLAELRTAWRHQVKATASKRQRTMKTLRALATPELPDLIHIYALEIPAEADVQAACERLAADAHVEYCQPDYLVEPMAFPQTLPDDTYVDPDQDDRWSRRAWEQNFEDLWGLKKIQAAAAWEATQGAGVVVAVVDSGVDYTHEDFTEDANANGLLDAGEDQNANGVLDSNIWLNANDPVGDVPDTCDRVANPTIALADDDCNGYIDDIRGWNFSAQHNDPMDTNGHGTWVAGIIAALGDNSRGIIGVAPQAEIMPLEAFYTSSDINLIADNGYGQSSAIAEAIVYAAQNGAGIINNSWRKVAFSSPASLSSDPVIEAAVRTADALGAVVVFAAGHEDDVAHYAPHNMVDPKPIVVSALSISDQPGSGSYSTMASTYGQPGRPAYGVPIDVAAPGLEVLGSFDFYVLSLKSGTCGFCSNAYYPDLGVGTSYVRQRGSSAAAAYASGTAALVRSLHPEFSNNDIRQVLRATTDDVADSGPDLFTGNGRVNAARALTVSMVPTAKLASPASGTWLDPEAGSISIEGTAAGNGFMQYELAYGVGEAPSTWTPISPASAEAVEDGTLATWDFSQVPSGRYLVRLTVTSAEGWQFQDMVQVLLERPATRITTEAAKLPGRGFDVSQRRFVWEDYRSGSDELYSCEYDPSTSQCAEARLVDGATSPEEPAISGDHVVWTGAGEGDANAEIYHCKYAPAAGSCAVEQITHHAGAQYNPDVSGDLIVWEDERNLDIDPDSDLDDDNADIYFCQYSAMTGICPEQQVPRNLNPQIEPAASGNWIAFEDDDLAPWESDAEDDENIYAYDISSGRFKQITRSSASQYDPDISEHLVIWAEDTEDASGLYLYDLAAGMTRRLTETIPLSYSVSGSRIAWDERGDVYFCDYDLTGHTCPKQAATIHPAVQLHPVVSENLITWLDNRDGRWDIYLRDLNSAPTLAPIGDKTVAVGQLLSVTISATDPDAGQALILSARLASGEALSTIGAVFTDAGNGTGTFQWTPTTAQAGLQPLVLFTVQDSGGRVDTETITITVPEVSLTVTAPGRGAVWLEGSTQLISWGVQGAPETIAVYAVDAAENSELLATLQGSARSYDWPVPATRQARDYTLELEVCVTAISGATACARSEPVTVRPAQIQLLTPAAGTPIALAAPLTVTWNSVLVGPGMTVNLLRGNAIIRLGSVPVSQNSFTWTPASKISAAELGTATYRIHLVSMPTTGSWQVTALSAPLTFTVAADGNVLYNGNFQAGSGGWTWGTGMTRITEPAPHNAVAQLTLASSLGRTLAHERVAVTAGRSYRVNVAMKTALTTGTAFVRVRWFTSTGSQAATDTTVTQVTGTTGWALKMLTVPAPAGTAFAEIQLRSTSGSGTVLYDDVQLVTQ